MGHSAILSTFIILPFSIKTFVLSIFELPLKTGFTGRPMEFSIKLHTISSGWFYVFRGVVISKHIVFLSLSKQCNLGLRCLQEYPFRGFRSSNGYAGTGLSQKIKIQSKHESFFN